MKVLVVLALSVFSHMALASGWMDIRVLPESVFTQGERGVFALLKEKDKVYPSERYECRLDLMADADVLAGLGQEQQQGSWTRWILKKPLHLEDREITQQMILTPDRGSQCLEWGPEYHDEGRLQRDCLRYAGHFRTMRSSMRMVDHRSRVEAMLSCEKWLSDVALDDNDQFFHIIRRSEGNLPFFFRADLD